MIADVCYTGPHHTPPDEYPKSCQIVDEANANLIAAAPDLLKALEAQESAEKYIEKHQGSPFFEETYSKMLDIAADIRRAAIAKAKGEGL